MNKKTTQRLWSYMVLKELENFKVNARGLSQYKIFKYYQRFIFFCVR